ncbi:MAG: hypothetical protein WCK67_03985 [bacterium]
MEIKSNIVNSYNKHLSESKKNISFQGIKATSALALPIIGSVGYQTYRDYKNAPKEEKAIILKKSALMLVVTGGVTLLTGKIGQSLLTNKNLTGNIKNILKSMPIPESKTNISKKIFTKDGIKYTKDILEDLSFSIGGIIAGIVGGQAIEKACPIKKNNINFAKLDPDLEFLSNAENSWDGTAKGYTFNGVKFASKFNAPMATLAGYSIAKQDGMKNKIKASVYEVVANIAIPTMFILPTSMLVKNLSKTKQFIVILPVALMSYFTGGIIGTKVNDKLFKDKVQAKTK